MPLIYKSIKQVLELCSPVIYTYQWMFLRVLLYMYVNKIGVLVTNYNFLP